MRETMLPYLRCPQTGAMLRLQVQTQNGADIQDGLLINTENDTIQYRIVGGVPRFVDIDILPEEQRDTVETFAYKWSQIPQYAFDADSKTYREAWYYERFGFKNGEASVRDFLGDARYILEAGTGTGVDTDMLARNSQATIFGIDISSAINIAYQRFQDNDQIHLSQADIGALPFAPEFFDVISCDQVLHHTPNPPEFFKRLVKLLKPGGKMLLYVYKVKGALREFSDDYLRGIYTQSSVDDAVDFSARLTRLGRNLSALHAKIEVEDDLPELGIKKGTYDVQRLIYDHILKCYWNDSFDFDTNVMVNFDWYRPLHAYRYTPDDVRGWCADNGLTLQHMDISPSGISTIMQKA
jgi:SAM-dependent methyltransferase